MTSIIAVLLATDITTTTSTVTTITNIYNTTFDGTVTIVNFKNHYNCTSVTIGMSTTVKHKFLKFPFFNLNVSKMKLKMYD